MYNNPKLTHKNFMSKIILSLKLYNRPKLVLLTKSESNLKWNDTWEHNVNPLFKLDHNF